MDGNIIVYDAENDYTPLKTLSAVPTPLASLNTHNHNNNNNTYNTINLNTTMNTSMNNSSMNNISSPNNNNNGSGSGVDGKHMPIRMCVSADHK